MSAILFDFGGTLDSNGISWKSRFYSIYTAFSFKKAQEEFDKAFYDADDNLHLRHNLKKTGFEETVKFQVEDFLNYFNIQDKKLAQQVSEKFLADSRKHLKKNELILKELKKKHKLGIVSNFYGNIEAVLKSEGLLKYFDAVADSKVVGAEKPDAKIFQYALDKLEVEAKDALMVGDSITRDMKGAENLGMPHALLLGDRVKQANEGICCSKAIVLSDLNELPQKISELLIK